MESILAFSLLFRYYKMLRSRTRRGTNRLISFLLLSDSFFLYPERSEGSLQSYAFSYPERSEGSLSSRRLPGDVHLHVETRHAAS